MRLIEHFFRILAPSDCLVCGNEGSLLCGWCAPEALPETFGRCYRCNALSAHSRTCAADRRKSPLTHLWVRTEYSDAARQLVHKMKFSYSGEAADIIAKELTNTLPKLSPEALLVPVPTATNHVRERGYDHTVRITKLLANWTSHRFEPALARANQLRQVGSSRRQRLQQMENAFRVRSAYPIKDAHIILVDDVLTTGATLEAAAHTLKVAGAKRIDALVFAQAK